VKKRYLAKGKNLELTVDPGGMIVGPVGQAVLRRGSNINFTPVYGETYGQYITAKEDEQKFIEACSMFKAAEIWEDKAYFEFPVTAKLISQHRESIGMTLEELGEILGKRSAAFAQTVENGESPITDAIKQKLREAMFFEV